MDWRIEMRLIGAIVLIGFLAIGGWWLWENHHFRGMISQYIENGEILTLESRYTADQIMDAHRKELLVDNEHSFDEPELKFHPYLLLDVKYMLPDQKTREGVILWSLVDGEMVINTETWDKTHGFEDAIDADASRTDFKILNALAKNGSTMTREQLLKQLNVEPEILEGWLASVRQKHLIIQNGNEIQLHFQNPKILVAPQTKINQWLVTKPYSHAQKAPKKYTQNQIKKISEAAFGNQFTIRGIQEVFLPVYSIEVINPDGSVLTTFWNALNGQRINPKYIANIR